MNTIKVSRFAALIALLLLPLAVVAGVVTTASANPGHDKVGICHRTNSDTNPYVYIEVPRAEANGHITGTDKSHNDQGRWKSDGTYRGVTHSAGDEKHDYFADSRADCADHPSTTTTTGSTSSTTTTSTSSPPVTTSSSTSSSSTGASSSTSTSPPTGKTSTSATRRSASSSHSASKPISKHASTSSPRTSAPRSLAYTGPVGNALALLAIACVLILAGLWFYKKSRGTGGGHR